MILKTILHGLIGAGLVAGAGYAWAEAARTPQPEPLSASASDTALPGEAGTRLSAVTDDTTDNGYIAMPRGDTRRWGEREHDDEGRGYRREHEGGFFGLFGEDDDD